MSRSDSTRSRLILQKVAVLVDRTTIGHLLTDMVVSINTLDEM